MYATIKLMNMIKKSQLSVPKYTDKNLGRRAEQFYRLESA
jgi:hypothetical protein